jgi:Spy/CpxP family protein refolding chaperone
MTTAARTRLASSVVLTLVFGSGLLLGAAIDRRLEGAQAPDPAELAASPAPQSPPPSLGGASDPNAPDADEAEAGGEEREPMYSQVGLTPEQSARIEQVVVDYREHVRALRAESRARYDEAYWALVTEVRDSIKALMSAEQVARYDELLSDSDERRRAREEAEREDEEQDRN